MKSNVLLGPAKSWLQTPEPLDTGIDETVGCHTDLVEGTVAGERAGTDEKATWPEQPVADRAL